MSQAPNLHLSCYLTLTLAAVCLGFAEMFFLPWMPWFLIALVLLIGLAWKQEGQWQLTESAANSLGLVIGFGMLGWIVLQLPRSNEELLAAAVPWPAGLLPHLGPLLMILTAVKLFRPKKVPDFWVLQILGVMMVTLASVLAGEADHGVWLFLYVVVAIWCLVHFHRMQFAWADLTVEKRRGAPLFAPEDLPKRFRWRHSSLWLGSAAAWSLVIAGLGMGLFFLAPRLAGVQWIPHKLSAAATGRPSVNRAAVLDLNRVGKIELSDEVAFDVRTRDRDGSVARLPGDIYWRGETLDYYEKGRWYSSGPTSDLWRGPPGENTGVWQRHLSVSEAHPTRRPSFRPDNVPAGKTYLTFHTLRSMAGMLVAAEPVDIDDGIGRFPYINEQPAAGIFEHIEGTDTVAAVRQSQRSSYRYGQVVDLSVNRAAQKARTIHSRYLQKILLQAPPPELVAWSRNLLARLAALSEAERSLADDDKVAPQHRERVARALVDYFAGSGEYWYTLNIRRIDTTKDPNVDFLLNVKEGHCERYASGLALTLRALGIPCRVVHGFRGWEQADDESLVVRFNQAHSWVQALVPRSDGEGEDWILLDATPSFEAPVDRWQAFVDWIGNSARTVRSAFRNGVLEYGPDQQIARLRAWWPSRRTITESISAVDWPMTALALAAAVVFGLLWTRVVRWRWPRQSLPGQRYPLPWLTEALALIRAKTGLAPRPSQTLLEFAAALHLGPTIDFARALDAVAHRVNLVRFGEQSLSDDDRAEIARSLAYLRGAAKVVA